MDQTLDSYIDAMAALFGLPIAPEWKPAIRTNLDVTLRMARLVDEFPLPDEIEQANVYVA
ncbi:DUF4089 domain-containing protein [Arenibacterium halophilum]|uniref:DUF4089 domain-containing protein n=1 Tax=Arenibacterium halophilum TaxID=2583821 RepID=A0ABY2WZB2_9RHOB|nr:DUF4089 domain-containing protein [Arenibacterium halophilum]TMV08292.1 DUF4089 domain-containing protein [Arenibacterium halophilum]